MEQGGQKREKQRKERRARRKAGRRGARKGDMEEGEALREFGTQAK